MSISITDLEHSTSLDQEAMNSVLGGWHNHSTSVSYGSYRNTGWSRWMNSGIPFTKKRYRDRYRTKTIKIRQHQRDWQYKAKIGFSI